MKISVISTPVFRVLPPPYYTKGYAGLEVIAAQVAYGLAQKGHHVRLFCPDGSECPGVEVIQIGPERISEKMAYSGFPAFTDGKGNVLRPRHYGYWQLLLDSDCVIDHSWGKYSYLLKAEGALKAPVLGVMHAPIPTMIGSPPPVEKPCVVCISQDQGNHYEALFSPHKMRVARNGCDPAFYAPLPGVKRTDRYLFLARFSTIKGPDLAQEVARRTGIGLDMVGDTTITGEPELLQRCIAAADGKQIKIIGGVSRGETVRWYSQAHAMLHLNQRFREPLGLAPIESMLGKSPVLSWKYGAMTETVKEGVSGYLVSSLDEAVEVVQSGKMDTINRDDCRQWAVDNFSLERMVNRYEELAVEAIDAPW